MNLVLLEELLRARGAKRPVALVTELASGRQQLADREGAPLAAGAARDAVRAALAGDFCAVVETDRGAVFVQPFLPPLRLVVVGAVHIAQPLSQMAALADYDVTIIDPRRAFASEDRFPAVAIVETWPDRAMRELDPDERTAVVALSHDPKLDDPALAAALESRAFYIGALGSRKTHALRLARLRERGFSDQALARIHGPVGLAVGARSPAEIAVAILAQMTEVLRRGSA